MFCINVSSIPRIIWLFRVFFFNKGKGFEVLVCAKCYRLACEQKKTNIWKVPLSKSLFLRPVNSVVGFTRYVHVSKIVSKSPFISELVSLLLRLTVVLSHQCTSCQSETLTASATGRCNFGSSLRFPLGLAHGDQIGTAVRVLRPSN